MQQNQLPNKKPLPSGKREKVELIEPITSTIQKRLTSDKINVNRKKNIAEQIMFKMGWTPGEGLGKNSNGIIQPILINPTHTIKSKQQRNKTEESLKQIKFISAEILGPTYKPHPCITIQIMSISVQALIDTGSAITCISANLYRQLQETHKNIPELPLKAIQVWSAFSRKSKKITKQVLMKIQLGNALLETTFLVIENLIQSCIFGLVLLLQV